MPMPNRQIVNGEPYRYAFQGQEKDPETGKEAFQLRLWDGRIGRWLTRDPMSIHHSPYLGMGNNPIIMVDPNGGYPTPYEGSLLAAHVYDNSVSLVGGWKLAKKLSFNRNDKQSGLQANLYTRKLKDGTVEHAYVYAGTEMTSGSDWTSNGRQLFGTAEQYSQALTIATNLSVELKAEELTFVGHSLGGGLANYSSLATGRSSMTFNPAWVSTSSINNTLKSQNISPTPFSNMQRNNYIHDRDPLHYLQKGSFINLITQKVGKNNFVDGGFFSNVGSGHFINTMVNRLLKTNGYSKIPYKKTTIEFGEGSFDFD
jgi:RHS repeat-associated protein